MGSLVGGEWGERQGKEGPVAGRRKRRGGKGRTLLAARPRIQEYRLREEEGRWKAE